MIDTDQLITRLSAGARPVGRLAPPHRRVLLWLAIGIPYVALVALVMTPRADLAEKLADARYLTEQGAALATAVLAATAAFSIGIPGRSRLFVLLPLPALVVWLGSLGEGCWRAWLRFGSDGLIVTPDWICFPAIVVAGAVPAAVMTAMLRRGAPMMPRLTVVLGALAAAALGNVGLRLFHAQDASLMVLVWQFGTVALLSALASALGGSLLTWRRVTA